MNGKIQFLNGVEEIDPIQWEALARESAVSTFFQTKTCYDFLASLPFYTPFVYGVSEGGKLKGVISGSIVSDGGRMKHFFSRRAIVNGGPLLADDISDDTLMALLEGCHRQLKKKAIYIETRNFNDYSRYKEAFLHAKFAYEPHYDIQIECRDWNAAEEGIGKHRKKYIRLSFRDGASIVESPTKEQVREFYGLLEELYRTKVKTPLCPYLFFEKLYDADFGRFLLVEYNGEIVGGSACVVLEGKGVYEWYACGKDGIYKNIHPSSVTKYAGMKYAAEHGYPVFDMMGAGAPDDGGYGVRDFKQEFGGKLVEYGRYKCVCSRLLYGLGSFAVKVLKYK